MQGAYDHLMLAHHPYEYNEQEQQMTKEEFVDFIRGLRDVPLEDGEKELIRFELKWRKGRVSMRKLLKHKEPVIEETTSVDEHESSGTPEVAAAP